MDLHHANSRATLDSVDWDRGRQAKTHPFRVRVTPSTIYNQETGEVVATVAPGYEFYYAHQHPHIAPIGYDTQAAIAEVETPSTQVAAPLAGGLPSMLGGILPLLMASSKKGTL